MILKCIILLLNRCDGQWPLFQDPREKNIFIYLNRESLFHINFFLKPGWMRVSGCCNFTKHVDVVLEGQEEKVWELGSLLDTFWWATASGGLYWYVSYRRGVLYENAAKFKETLIHPYILWPLSQDTISFTNWIYQVDYNWYIQIA